jgi:hypothetical protein
MRIRGELFAIPTNDLHHSVSPPPAPVVIEMVTKYQPSDAYSRIRKTGVYSRNTVRRRPAPSFVPREKNDEAEGDDEEDDQEEEDSNDDDESGTNDHDEDDNSDEDEEEDESQKGNNKQKKSNSFLNFFRMS